MAKFQYELHGNARVYRCEAVCVVIILSGRFAESNFSRVGIYITVVNRRQIDKTISMFILCYQLNHDLCVYQHRL
jgi:hypothetical protein